jgi:hypothetical protein
MWVEVVAIGKRHLRGVLRNHPLGIPRLDWGDQVKFTRDHIIDTKWEPDWGTATPATVSATTPLPCTSGAALLMSFLRRIQNRLR